MVVVDKNFIIQNEKDEWSGKKDRMKIRSITKVSI